LLRCSFLSCSVVHRVLHSFPTRRSSDLRSPCPAPASMSRCPPRRWSPRSWPTWDFVLDVNLKGGFFCAQAAARVMVAGGRRGSRSEEHTSELQSRFDLVCRLLLEKKNIN